ncbi:MAG: hypothetical protein QOJ41_72, partial [Acidobacteriaceae bacterium]|nr:hypothetical protein [Acidobacteriaceae bacterium]
WHPFYPGFPFLLPGRPISYTGARQYAMLQLSLIQPIDMHAFNDYEAKISWARIKACLVFL